MKIKTGQPASRIEGNGKVSLRRPKFSITKGRSAPRREKKREEEEEEEEEGEEEGEGEKEEEEEVSVPNVLFCCLILQSVSNIKPE